MQFGDVFDVTQAYLAWHERKQAASEQRPARHSGGEFEIIDLEVNGSGGTQPALMEIGGTLQMSSRIRSRDARVPIAMFGIVRADGTPVYGVSTDMDEVSVQRLSDHEYRVEIEFVGLSVLPGSYQVRIHTMDTEGLRLFDTLERGLTIRGESREFGLVRLPHNWKQAAGDRSG